MRSIEDQISALGTQRGAEAWLMAMALLLGLMGVAIWLLSLTAPSEGTGSTRRWFHRLTHRNTVIG